MKKLIATAPQTLEWQDYEDSNLNADEVLIRIKFASPKHGSEIADFRGNSPLITEKYDSDWHLIMPREADEPVGVLFGQWNVGNMIVGIIEKCGDLVKEFQIGDRVMSYGGIRETLIVKAIDNHRLRKLPDEMPWQNALCYDPAQFALGGIRDGNVKPGDTVAIMGLGAIGQLAVQMAKHIGASKIIAIDPVENRREVAMKNGATHVLNPIANDIGLDLKSLTNKMGVDVVIETSGSMHALQSSFRGVAYGGTICYVAWSKTFPEGLNLGREAHYNYAKLIFSRVASEPLPDYPRWNRKRIEDTVWQLLSQGYLHCEDIIQPVVDATEAISAYHHFVDQHPEESIKLGIRF